MNVAVFSSQPISAQSLETEYDEFVIREKFIV